MSKDSCDRAEHKSPRSCSHGTDPIAVHPVACKTQLEGNEYSAKKRPPRRHPRTQHPINCRAHRGGGEKYAYPGRAKNLANSENRALGWRIHRGIGWKPVDVERFEADPHRVRRIRQAAMGERVCHEEIAELIVDSRVGHGEKGKERHANRSHAKKEKRSTKHEAAAHFSKHAFNRAEKYFVPAGEKHREEEKKNGDCGGENHAAASPSGSRMRLRF